MGLPSTRAARSVPVVILRQAGLLFAALAMFAIAGGHWAVLQSVAWAGMLADYTRASGSVATAVGQTFDGEHPCALCRQIAAARGQVKSPSDSSTPAGADQKFKVGKTEGVLAENGFQPRITSGIVRWFESAFVVPPPRGQAPPVPPPRSRAA